ncbi:MAG: membrane protein insertase YidC [Candidatus Sungbacteria bacterium]|nr:membrane protein insertase YidC [Candidatus Sungbacteria bacterium]
MIVDWYNEILYRPLVNVLVFLYEMLPYHDLGLAIVLLTVAVRLMLYPLISRSMNAQKELARLQPEIKALQEKHKENREEQARHIMELYRTRGVNPFSGCLPVLIQLPLLFALYQVFLHATGAELLQALYAFTPRPEALNPIAFGVLDLSKPSIVMAILAGASQFLQGYLMPRVAPGRETEMGMQRALQIQTVYVFPILITILSFRFPAALALYWVVLNVVGILQQEIVRRRTA